MIEIVRGLIFNIRVYTFMLYGLSTFCLFPSVCAQNVAQLKPYVLSDKPNYTGVKITNINSSLTDGIIQKTNTPTFWTNGKSLGWMNKNKIEIEIDLKKNFPISTISLNSANGEQNGVYYPSNIYVFSSSDKQNYKYVGDLIATGKKTRSGTDSKSVTNFSLGKVNTKGRYVKFVIFPYKNYFFVDEIQIEAGKFDKPKGYQQTAISAITNFIEDIAHKNKTVTGTDSFAEKQLKTMKEDKLEEGIIVENIENIRKILVSDRPRKEQVLSAISKSGFVNSSTGVTIKVTNNSRVKQNVQFKDKLRQVKNTKVYILDNIVNSKSAEVLDALVPYSSSGSFFLSPGESRHIFLKTNFLVSGSFKQEFTFETDNKLPNANLSIIYNIHKTPSGILNANNWAYFNYPQISSNRHAAIMDLQEHGINTFVIPRDILSKVNTDDVAFTNYFKGVPTNSNILLFYNFSSNDAKRIAGNENVPYFSTTWKSQFKKLLERTISQIKSLGYSKIYIYPYDEIDGKNMEDFKKLVLWLRKDLGYKCYATVLSKSSIHAGNYVDVIQVNRKLLRDPAVSTLKAEKWMYDIMDYARDRDPWDYRKMGWEAYYYDLKGIGFWNYSRTSQSKNLYNAKYTTGREDYAIIYNDEKGNILPSVRWEAFNLGIQDYYKFKALERVKGKRWILSFIKDNILVNDPDKNMKAVTTLEDLLD